MVQTEITTLKQGTIIDEKWIIIELIGRGAMGEVYRAHQVNLKRDVAIKIISENVIAELENDPEELEVAFGRFQREVQTMAKVRHPNILAIYDYGEFEYEQDSGKSRSAYIAMEYIPGDSFRFTLEEDGLDDDPELYTAWILKYFFPVLDGVEILHNNKIVHRDLKPENIFLDGEIPKIGDFGLARSYQMRAVTSSIEMLGTLAYMSPEQCADFKKADFTADIYALGKVLYEAAQGTLTEKTVPFTSVSIASPEGSFMTSVSGIIRKATQEKAEKRYQTVQEMRIALNEALKILNKVKGEGQRRATVSPTLISGSRKPASLLIIGAMVVVLSFTGMGIYHLVDNRNSSIELDDLKYTDHANMPGAQQVVLSKIPHSSEKSIIGKDGALMLFTGEIVSDEDTPLFYVDERKVTNFLFIEFLNSITENISVKSGVVKYGDTILIYIGDGSGANDAIVFKHNRFHLKDQLLGPNPVVRVTYHGAHMYAVHYDKDLLTEQEWLYAYQYHQGLEEAPQGDSGASDTDFSSSMMHDSITPESLETNLSPLDDMGYQVKEWVRTTHNAATGDTGESKSGGYESGVLDIRLLRSEEGALKRYPWEGFDDVGFRTKIPVVRK